jgi:hypothetical protein
MSTNSSNPSDQFKTCENCDDHADYSLDLTGSLRISLDSQLRVLSCRLNADPNALVIDSIDNSFALVLTDHWNKNYGIIPLLPITLIKESITLTTVNDLSQM